MLQVDVGSNFFRIWSEISRRRVFDADPDDGDDRLCDDRVTSATSRDVGGSLGNVVTASRDAFEAS